MRPLRFVASRVAISGELIAFLWGRKLWWLVPMVVMLLLFGLLMVFAESSGAGPFIYAVF
jgi:drug/metabolite transporter superfamily protein YnfA